MGELEVATRRTWGFGDVPEGVSCHDSLTGLGERAKFGMRNVPRGLERGTLRAALSDDASLLSLVLSGVFGGLTVLPLLPTAMLSCT